MKSNTQIYLEHIVFIGNSDKMCVYITIEDGYIKVKLFLGVFMKRYITIMGDIIFKEYTSGNWELIVEIYPEDIVPFYMELQLLAFNLSESFTVTSLNSSISVNITFIRDTKESRIRFEKIKYMLELSNNDFDVISMFILQYYRDSCAPVSHIHLDIAKDESIKGKGELTILASASV